MLDSNIGPSQENPGIQSDFVPESQDNQFALKPDVKLLKLIIVVD